MSYRYFVTENGEPEREVDMAGFVAVERRAGFRNTMGKPDEPGTAGFGATRGGVELRGRVEWIRDGEATHG